MATFVLEIRTEEVPANALPAAREQLAGGFASRLEAAGLGDAAVAALSTSRRLVVRIMGLPERQPDRVERVSGPPRSVAFSDDGSPTKAAEGFARKVGLTVADLETVATDKGEYLAATVTHPGRPTGEILAEMVPEVVASLRFPKTMRWGRGEHVFVRPVHGVVALLDEEVVELEVLGVRSGRHTLGHRVHAPGDVEIGHADEYPGALAEAGVVIDPVARQATLLARSAELAAAADCTVVPDPDLVSEHVELVEQPELIRGDLDQRFLELPREVVVTTLRHHQKCLTLEKDGALAPHFLAVVDRRDDPEGLIRQGNEWVIGARLADARFFFDEDRKRPLADLVPELERVEHHRELGSVAAKAARVGELAADLAADLGLDLDSEEIRRAARLVKADLVSHMVGEFPELQGVMGGHYLRLQGEPEAVWTAAADHYRPHGFAGDLPRSELGRLLAAADRLDSLCGMFAVGASPSGSRDPYGLRRAAQGLVRILAECDWDMAPAAAIECAVALVADAVACSAEEVRTAVEAFVADRVRRYLTDAVGVAGDTADAVMGAAASSLPDLVARARALDAVRAAPHFRSLALAHKRVRNITADQPDGQVRPELFSDAEERELHAAVTEFHSRLSELLPARLLDAAFAAMEPIADVLDRFFVEVLVMTDDEAVRSNRIALLKELGRDFLALADLSKLQVEGDEQ